MKSYKTFYSSFLPTTAEIPSGESVVVTNHGMAVRINTKIDRPQGEVVRLWLRSDQDVVRYSLNPVSLDEDAQTRLLNRYVELGYEPVLASTSKPTV